MDKAYNHNDAEDKIYQAWEDSGKMRADATSKKPPFTIPLPPPNVTGTLHLGHAAMLAIEDIMIRYKKMQGHEVLWLPGTDHAAIATENVVIKHHGKKSREEWSSREDFLGDCRNFAGEKHDNIVNQMKKMGSWLDWSREAYTFDEPRNHAVNTIFKSLFEDGLIERGHRLINWSIGAQSVLSDDELEWDEVKEPFYYIKCGEFIIGTVRPETKCADSPLIVHPESNYIRAEFTGSNRKSEVYIVIENLFNDEEKRNKILNLLDAKGSWKVLESFTGKELEGQEFQYETYAGTRSFYILADEIIDPEKGAGAMTISASHSADDYDLAKRKNLKETFIQKIDFEGKMTKIAGSCAGLSIEEARAQSGKIMKEQGLLVGIDKTYQHRVPLCYRSNCIVEPMISPQWFIMVEKKYTHPIDGETTLKAQMQAAVRKNHVQIIPEKFDKEYFRWIDNLQDWCISRQIWWGHRIPVWYDEDEKIHLATEQEIIFARHGESEGNRDGKAQSLDDPLTKKGEQHAADMVDVLKNENIGIIVSGTALRNVQTAEVISKGLGVEMVNIPELGSYDFGEVSGMTYDEMNRITPIKYCKENGKGEDFNAFITRLKVGLEKLKDIRSHGKILFVTNRSIYSVLQTLREGGDPDKIFEKRSKNSHLPHGIIDRWSIHQAPEGKNLRQDEDTLDTWFSSALWPFSTLGWPNEEAPDLQKFFNNAVNGQGTDVLETGWDILFFWVARMIMFSRYATGKYPFHTVYLHGMVTDEHGKKMSKSKGNGIDPLGMIDKFGADPVRLALVIGSSPGNPIPIGENKIKGYRNFVNKLWNATRFVQMQTEGISISNQTPQPKSLADQWICSRMTEVSNEVAEHFEKYEISSAGDKIYHFVWGEFCDWYLEASKVNPNPEMLQFLIKEILKLTHPLCPFVTENLWQELHGEQHSIVDEAFPTLDLKSAEAQQGFTQVQNIIAQIRSLRADNKLNPKDKLQVSGNPATPELEKLIEVLAGVKFSETKEATTKIVEGDLEINIEIPVDENRKEKEIQALEKIIFNLKNRLKNKAYVDKAPQSLVDQTKADLTQAEEKLKKIS